MKRYKRPPVVKESDYIHFGTSITPENRQFLMEYAASKNLFMYEAVHDLITEFKSNYKLKDKITKRPGRRKKG